MTEYKLTTDRAAAVAPGIKWMEIDLLTPTGTKMLLINRRQGIAVISTRRPSDTWTHWAPLPTFTETESEQD